jgi:hypothetical protein
MTTMHLPIAVAAVSAIAASGALAMPAIVQAHPRVPLPLAPPCSAGYQFPGGAMTILYPDAAAGTKTEFSLNLPSPNVDTAAVTRYPQGGDMNGSVTGKVTGNTVNLKVNRDGYSALTLTGSIAPDGRGHGTLPFGDGKQRWDSLESFDCLPEPAPDKVGPSPKPVGDNPAPPPGGQSSQGPNDLAPDQPVAVTDAIRLSFGPPTFTSITATVTNSSELKATCTYDASPSDTHRDFTVPPKGSTNLTFNGLSLGATYHAVVSCHDASGQQPQEIGHAETDVTF